MMTEFVELGSKVTDAVMAWLLPCIFVPSALALAGLIFAFIAEVFREW